MSTWFLCQGKGISYNITTNINPIFTDFYTSKNKVVMIHNRYLFQEKLFLHILVWHVILFRQVKSFSLVVCAHK